MQARLCGAIVLLALVAAVSAHIRGPVTAEKRPRGPAPTLDHIPALPLDGTGTPITNLTVYVIPHSHDDTGWQRNVDQYYEEEVRYIYDTVVEALRENSKRKFIFVETAFFMRWWRDQDETTQAATKQLVANGQIEFVDGGWCMADDASPSMDAEIDQNTLGHRYVKDTLGVVPKYAWHIDPFGLSASYALWFKAMNMTAWLFNRVDTRLKDLWHNDTRLQFNWEPAGAGDNEGVFGHVLDTHYGAPEITYKNTHFHYDFEYFGGLGGGSNPGSNIPMSAKSPSPFYNATVPDAAEAFVALAKLRAGWYRLGPPWQNLPPGHAAILVPFGDDMKFQNAHKQYSNMEALMERVNGNFAEWGVNLQYGVIDDYFKLVKTDDKQQWPDYASDFFPLGTNGNIYTSQGNWLKPGTTQYWTGHYTTRPLMKGLVAKADGAKHTTEIAASIACGLAGSAAAMQPLCGETPSPDLMLARDVTSVLQHHDNIPGTSAPDAALNLDLRLRASLAASGRVMAAAASGGALAATDARTATDAEAAAGRRTVAVGESVTLWNSLAQPRDEVVELQLANGSSTAVKVVTADGAAVPSAVIAPVPGFGYEDDAWSRSATLVFQVTLPPLASAVFHVAADAAGATPAQWACMTVGAGPPAAVTISGGAVSVNFSTATGLMTSMHAGGAARRISQQFAQYHASSGSDAYHFQPDRKQYPFGEPLSQTASSMRICAARSAVVERVVQSYIVGSGINCTSEATCKASCPKGGGFSVCPKTGVYYCCADHQHCGGTFACKANGGLHDCACTTPNAPEPLMLEETVSVFPLETAVPVVQTTSEFEMVLKDRELVTRYLTDVDNTDGAARRPRFETDANGMLMMTRVVNQTGWGLNESYFTNSDLPVAGNYYPLASPGAIRIADTASGKAFAVVTDRAHGASSLQKGWVEVMMGRRVAETGGITVDDTDHVVGRNWLFPAATAKLAAKAHRDQAQKLQAPLVPVVAATAVVQRHKMDPKATTAATAGSLPPNVHLLTLDRLGVETTAGANTAARVLVRLQHMYQQGEAAAALTSKATVDLTTLLPAGLKLSNIVEWPLNGVGTAPAAVPYPDAIELTCLQIRTFEAVIQKAGASPRIVFDGN